MYKVCSWSRDTFYIAIYLTVAMTELQHQYKQWLSNHKNGVETLALFLIIRSQANCTPRVINELFSKTLLSCLYFYTLGH